MGLLPSSGQEPAARPEGGTQGMSTATPESPATAAAAAEPKPQPAAGTPAVVTEQPEERAPAVSPALQAAERTRLPMWVMPLLVMLPFWGIFYLGAFGDRTVKKVVTPQEVYAKAGCGSCHGTQGEGGTGPALAGGQASLTFPSEQDHVNWVKNGSGAATGQKYGDPNRPGGQRGPASGGMPGFSGQLSEAEIEMVVKYEREEL